ncbi:MAG: hypothetical protein ACPLPT_10450 [Moorellales bacterium]
MRPMLPYLISLGSLALVTFLTWWEIAHYRPRATGSVRIYLEPVGVETLEGVIRLTLWRAGWRGIPLGVELLDPGLCPSLSALAARLARAYPGVVTYRPADETPTTQSGANPPAAGRGFVGKREL